jgi:hypothetical protein
MCGWIPVRASGTPEQERPRNPVGDLRRAANSAAFYCPERFHSIKLESGASLGDRSMKYLKNLPAMPGRIERALIASLILAAFCVGCTRAELEHKADAYNAAIAQSNNRQILLNAVRASQRAPMSFVGFGEVAANPNYSGSTNATFNFSPAALSSWVLNPSVNYGGGFSSFTLSNLNSSEYMTAIQNPLTPEQVRYFRNLSWPKEMIDLLIADSFVLKREDLLGMDNEVRSRCDNPRDQRTVEICQRLLEDEAEFRAEGCQEFQYGPVVKILNTAREFCGMNVYQRFLRKKRLLDRNPRFNARSIQGMLYYLGELIAAQNYSVHQYTPKVFVEVAGTHRLVPLFEVRRGAPPLGQAAVEVLHDNEMFYIPKPALGTIDEARSLQVLDFVSIALALRTAKNDLPKSTTVTLVPSR